MKDSQIGNSNSRKDSERQKNASKQVFVIYAEISSQKIPSNLFS